ncbi:MAG: hypothetical protein ACU0AZ_14175 [Paracoccaceae bacterium]
MKLREALSWFMLVFVLGRITTEAASHTPADLFDAFSNHNLIYLLAYAAIISRMRAVDAHVSASRRDLVALCGSALFLVAASFMGVAILDGVPALALGAYFLMSRQRVRDVSLAAVGTVFAALGANLIVARMVQMAFQAEIVAIDAFVVQRALWLTGDAAPRVANRVMTEDGFAISIIGACSAFNNITLIALAIVSAIMWARPYFVKKDLLWFAIGTVVIIAINTVRLGLMALNLESYHYWHHDGGALIFSVVQTSCVLAIAYSASRLPKQRAVTL